MIIVECKHHTIFSNKNSEPDLRCQGPCERLWWSIEAESSCNVCGGELAPCKDGYTVLFQANRALRLSDFKKHAKLDSKVKAQLNDIHQKGLLPHLSDMSLIKPAYAKKAAERWL